MDGWRIEEDIAGTRHCLEVAECAIDKTRDIRARGVTNAAKAG